MFFMNLEVVKSDGSNEEFQPKYASSRVEQTLRSEVVERRGGCIRPTNEQLAIDVYKKRSQGPNPEG